MKYFFTIILTIATLGLIAQSNYTDPPGTHGMLVFGMEEVFVSHLPMFHSPHDYQVIASIQLPQQIKEKYLASIAEDEEETVYTLVPEKFILPEMIEDPRTFKAVLYKGHFERGGEPITEEFDLDLVRIIHFRKFDQQAIRPGSPNFIFFGNSVEQFAAHHITAKPDFDQLMAIEVKGNKQILVDWDQTILNLNFSAYNNVALEEASTHDVEALFSFKVRTLYLEYGDLAQ